MENKGVARVRVTLVIDTLRGGGAERSTVNLARGLIDRGHSVDLVTFSEDVARYEHELAGQVRLIKVNLRRNNSFRRRVDQIQVLWRYRGRLSRLMKSQIHGNTHPYIGLKWFRMLRGRSLEDSRALVEYIDQEKPDCILPSLDRATVSTLLARSFSEWNPPVVPIVRAVLQKRTKKHRNRFRLFFPLANEIVAVSRGLKEDVARQLRIPSTRITQIYNPVDIQNIESLANERPDHPWMQDGGPPTIVSTGRLTQDKDFLTLLKAVAEVRKRTLLRLIILGEGGCRTKLEAFVFESGIEDSVSLPGWVENPFSYMRRAAAFVLSSKWEGLGNVLIEALACGCPVVATDCPSGPSEILDHGRVGPLVPVGDYIGLAEAIENVLANPPDKEALRTQAARFSFKTSIDHYERLIHSVRKNDGCHLCKTS